MGEEDSSLAAAPLADWICRGLAPPWPPIYMWGGRGQPHLSPGASPPPVTPPNSHAGRPAKPCCDLHCIRHHAVVLPDL